MQSTSGLLQDPRICCSFLRPEKCNSKPDILGIYQAKRIVAKKICNGKPMFMVKWQTYCTSENTSEPNAHLPSELLEAFEHPEPHSVRVEQARERISRV